MYFSYSCEYDQSVIFQPCVNLSSTPEGTDTRTVGITVVSNDCGKPVEGATFIQFCDTFTDGVLNDVRM